MTTEPTQRGDAERVLELLRAAWFEDVAASEAVRLATIQILGFMSLLGGLLIAVTGPVSPGIYLAFDRVPGWPVFLGCLLSLFGATQLVGVFFSRPLLACIGSAAGAIWYIGFAGAFVSSWVRWALGSPYLGDMPVVYPCLPYFGIAAIHVVQAITTYKKVRDNARRDRSMGAV